MKREFNVLFLENQQSGYVPGDEAAHRAAAALADRADAPTIAALADALTLLERIGGQFFLTALRLADEGADFETAGLAFSYETRDARIKTAAPPDGAFGVVVTDAQAPAVEIQPPEPEVATAEEGATSEPDETPALTE